MEEKEEKNLQIRERESRRSGVLNDLRCEAGKSQKYRAERPYEIFLAELISCSRVFDREAEAESRRRWDRIGKPIDGLGKLETMVSKIAGMTGTPDVKIRRKAVAVMCGDDGAGSGAYRRRNLGRLSHGPRRRRGRICSGSGNRL